MSYVLFPSDSDGKGMLSKAWDGRKEVRVVVKIVRDRIGTLSFLVRRIEMDEALNADRRAR